MSEKTENALVRIQTTVPIVALVMLAIAGGKLVSDVSHIRSMIEEQGRTLQNTVSRFDDLSQRTARIEAYIGIQDGRPVIDGSKRGDR